MLALAQGWKLPWIVSPMQGYHGTFAVMLERELANLPAKGHHS